MLKINFNSTQIYISMVNSKSLITSQNKINLKKFIL
jgi:hypothetical protein